MQPRGASRWGARLVIMVKEPVLGRVKTRLARACGSTRATAFLRTNLDVTLRRLAGDCRWQTILAISPDTAVPSRMFVHRAPRMPQGAGGLGCKMTYIARNAPAGPLVIIGADIPGIRCSDIARAFKLLRRSDAVFGPADDGGYWLVGLNMRTRRHDVFTNVRWSSPHALADTLANLEGYRIALASVKHDVDDGADLERLGGCAQRLIL